jgi:hypothetical protein
MFFAAFLRITYYIQHIKWKTTELAQFHCPVQYRQGFEKCLRLIPKQLQQGRYFIGTVQRLCFLDGATHL